MAAALGSPPPCDETIPVLAVDDQDEVLDAFRTILAPDPDPGYSTLIGGAPTAGPTGPRLVLECARGGAAALDAIRRRHASGDPFLVAFVDMRMPGMDGLATVRALWEVDHRLEVVICTAWSDHTLEDLRAGLGSRSRFLVLRKPFDPIEVQQLAGALGEKWLLARRAEARAQAEQLELLGRLAGGIAHDLNNVLAAILGYTELARLRLGPHAAASELLTRIAEAGGQGRRIASRLLALARRRPPMPERVEFDPLLAELQPLLVQLAGGTCGIDIRTGAAGAAVLLDQAQAAQILLNLTVNARDAMADGGMIRIATGIDHAGGRLVLEVGDDGPGIPPDVRRHLFEPFFTTKAPGRGSGMGLGVVQDAVRSAAGSIQVHSAPGEGTTFRIELPLAGLPEPARPPSPLTGVRVLMVDDDASICELVRITVEGAGGRCRTVLDHDAADLARADEPVDVLISDLRLGGQDADATLRRLARDWSGTPCVVVSGDLPDRLPAGVHGLAKPFSPTALVELTADLARPAG